MKKYYNEKGEFAVIVSPRWGSGWSTWNEGISPHDGDFIKLLIREGCVENDVINIRKDKFSSNVCLCGDSQVKEGLITKINTYFGTKVFAYGLEGAKIEYLEKGTLFNISENQGAEEIDICCDFWYM